MSIKKYYYKVQETSATLGTIGLTLDGASTGYLRFIDTIGTNKDFTYNVLNNANTLEWEYGIGHLENVAGNYILSRDQILSSSAGISLVSFSSGTKVVDLIVTDHNIANLSIISGNSNVDYISSSYIVDASTGNLTINLPSIADGFDNASNTQSVLLSFVLNSTSGNVNEQVDAITIVPSGADTVGGTGQYTLSIKNDYIQLISNPASNDWVLLDPIQDSIYPSGGDGAIQFSENQSFSYSSGLYWDTNNDSLLIGSSGINNATIVLSSLSSTIFNNTSGNVDFVINGSGQNILFADASQNYIGIKTNSPSKTLDVNISGSDGICVKTNQSSSTPQYILKNTYTGLSQGDDLGAIVFNSVDSAANSTDYVKILAEFISDTNGSEEGLLKLQVNKDGVLQTVAEYAYSGIVLGHDNTNVNGIVIGEQNTNYGDNIIIGYYSSGNAVNSIILGDNNIISSGSFGGLVGKNHSISGVNTWIVGGSGLSVTGSNATYLVSDSNNYIQLQSSGRLTYHGLNSSGIVVKLVNEQVLTSGNTDSLSLNYYNSAGEEITGLKISNKIYVPTSGNETSALEVYSNQTGIDVKIVDIRNNHISIGNNTISSGNIIYGNSNTVSDSGNIILGTDMVVSGTDITAIGTNNTISSGIDNITVLGKNNTIDYSGNNNITIVGLSNNVDEDYSTTIGINNTNSGLYGTVIGFDNGVNGSYISVVGEQNNIITDASVVLGNNNLINSTGINAQGFAVGVGNTISASGTGLSVGSNNTIYGTSAALYGISNYSSGLNNLILGNSNTLNGSGLVVIGNSITYSGLNSTYVASTGASIELTSNQIKLSGDIYVNNTGIEEYVQDIIGSNISGTGSVTVSYDDGNDLILVSGQTIYNETISIVGLSGVSGSGSFTLNQSSGVTINLEHTDTSSVSDTGLTNVSGNVIQSISMQYDTYGHTTGISISSTDLDTRYALTSHTHTSSNITDFNSAVSGLLPVKDVNGSGYVVVTDLAGVYTVSVTGLQPSGSYASATHTHTSSDITDFNSSVSGLLPVKNLTEGTGIDITSTTGNYTIHVNPANLLPHIVASGGGSLVNSTGTFSISNTLTTGTIIPQMLTLKFGQSVTDLEVVVSGLNQTLNIDSVLGSGAVYYNSVISEGDVVISGSPSSYNISVTYSGTGGEVSTSMELYIIGIKI